MTQEDGYGSETSYHNTMTRQEDLKHGEYLMMQRTLLKTTIEKEPPQRKKLFKKTCKVNGKVCRVIIDYGSTNSIASIKMVDMLKFKRIPHPYPYRAPWLIRDKHTFLSEQVWVEFNIGEYKDKVLYDICEMDACHLLLGRPWKYDVKARHEGETNVYHITKGGVKYTLNP